MKTLTRSNLIEDLRRIGRERGLTRPRLGAVVGRDACNVPTVRRQRRVSYHALVEWLGKLGYEVRCEVVRRRDPG